jgi:hypothetical protein
LTAFSSALGDVTLGRPDDDVQLRARRQRARPLGVEEHLGLLALVGQDARIATPRELADRVQLAGRKRLANPAMSLSSKLLRAHDRDRACPRR